MVILTRCYGTSPLSVGFRSADGHTIAKTVIDPRRRHSRLRPSMRFGLILIGLLWAGLLAPEPVGAIDQGPGLYKDGRKLMPLDQMIDPSVAISRDINTQTAEDAPLLRDQLLGSRAPSDPIPRNWAQTVLRVRDALLAPGDSVTAVLNIESDLLNADLAMTARFEMLESELLEKGLPLDKSDRLYEVAANHRRVADELLNILGSLRATSDAEAGAWLDQLRAFFERVQFVAEPRQYSAQPLPVTIDRREATAMQVSEASPAGRAIPIAAAGSRGYDPADLLPTIDVQFTAAITDLADSLGKSPVKMYSYVREQIKFEPYLGSRKGGQQTLSHKAGNDYDQASLLIALYRSSGIPARYAGGTIEIPIERAKNWLGIQDARNAASLLATAGMGGMLMLSGSDTVAIRCSRVWVEAYIPYANYRGAINDSSGFMWVTIDPVFAQYGYTWGIDLPDEIGFDAETFVQDYYSSFHAETPVDLFRTMLTDSLAARYPGADFEELRTARSVVVQTDGIIPGTLPFELVTFGSRYSEIPANMRYQVQFHVYGSGTDLSYSTSLPEINEKQVTISYVGATAADQQIIDDAGGIFYVADPYLVDLQPVLKIDGCEVVRGTGSVVMGVSHYSDMHFTAPTGASNQMPTVSNLITAGNYQGIGIDTHDALPDVFDSSAISCPEAHLGYELHQTALTYLNNVDVGGDDAASLLHFVVLNDVSEAIVENSVSVWFDGYGNPISFDWTGMIVDADRKIIGPFSVYGMGDACDYMRLAGADGSIQENRVFETRFDEEAISAVKIIELAADSGITICEILTSIGADCPGISQPSQIITAINNALAQGRQVTIPADPITYYNWSGTGYIEMDPIDCAAGYIISGGHNGGATVQGWDITYPDLYCIEPIGPISVSPLAQGDIYCGESSESWDFALTIKYWGKDTEGSCQLLSTVAKNFRVSYTIKELADTYGPGEYVFTCGSNTTECGCSILEKTVTIVEASLEGPESMTWCEIKDPQTNASPAGGSFTGWSSSDPAVVAVDPSSGQLTAAGVGSATISVDYELSGVSCPAGDFTITVTGKTLSALSSWNDDNYVRDNNNCYNYATDIRTNTYAQPGMASTGSGVPSPVTCTGASSAATSDGLIPISIPDLSNPCGSVSGLPDGGHIVALIASGVGHVGRTDYHWYRMEADGTWTHKPGWDYATNRDEHGDIITDPRTAAWSSYYDDFCEFYYVKPGITIK